MKNEELREKCKEIVRSIEVQRTASNKKIEALEVEYLSKLNELQQIKKIQNIKKKKKLC